MEGEVQYPVELMGCSVASWFKVSLMKDGLALYDFPPSVSEDELPEIETDLKNLKEMVKELRSILKDLEKQLDSTP